MTPEQLDRVFGRGRLKMATGEHVEVFREPVRTGERRRYTKRFLSTQEGDFGHWTEREWRILARLIGHGIGCVPEVVQIDRAALGGTQIVQTYDAGATVDQWATILPVRRDGRVYRHVFEDCAHWWALAHHCLSALRAIHALQLVHLDIKGDNVCVPVGPANFDPDGSGVRLFPLFGQLALIDFAFSLVSREPLSHALPIGWQTTYDYQSPRLLHALEAGRNGDLQPTRELDWRCDMYSLAAMLKRYLPDDDLVRGGVEAAGWSDARYHCAKTLLLALRDSHDRESVHGHPHDELLELTQAQLASSDMIASLDAGWTLARDADIGPVSALPITPLTRLAPSLRTTGGHIAARAPVPRTIGSLPPILISPRAPMRAPSVVRRRAVRTSVTGLSSSADHVERRSAPWVTAALLALIGGTFAVAIAPQLRNDVPEIATAAEALANGVRQALSRSKTEPPARTETAAQRSDPDQPEPRADATATPPAAEAGPAPAPSEAAPSGAPMEQPAATEPLHSDAGISRTPTPVVTPSRPSSHTPPPPRVAKQRMLPASPPLALSMNERESSAPVVGATVGRKEAASAHAPSHNSQTASPPTVTASNARNASTSRTQANTSMRASVADRANSHARVESAPAQSSTPSGRETDGATRESVAKTAPAAVPAPPQETKLAALAPIAAGESAKSREASPATPAETKVAEPAPVASSSPRREPMRSQPPPHEGILTSLLNLAKRGGKAAPIEERVAAAPTRVAAASTETRRSVERPISTSTTEVAREAAPPPRPDVAREAAPPPRAVVAEAAPSPRPVVAEAAPASRPAVAAEMVTQPIPPALSPGFSNAATGSGGGAPSTALSYAEKADAMPEETIALASADPSAQGRRAVADVVSRSATQIEAEIARVLARAAASYRLEEQQWIVDAARRRFDRNAIPVAATTVSVGATTPLKDEARRAFFAQRDLDRTLDLHLQAFGADPYDAEIAGNLASLYLRVRPLQPHAARQLVMHAIAVGSVQSRAPRAQDWSTFAIASALVGHDDDATHGLFVAAALATNLPGTCKTALNAVAIYGDRMRVPVESMLLRMQQQGRDRESPYCSFPPRWTSAGRFY